MVYKADTVRAGPLLAVFVPVMFLGQTMTVFPGPLSQGIMHNFCALKSLLEIGIEGLMTFRMRGEGSTCKIDRLCCGIEGLSQSIKDKQNRSIASAVRRQQP